ncbi:DUF2391 domain-containing protein [Halorussus lipolyticus]|uniref:DUF2391 domain-containing protein n=1 Tax=Halorussus lipolyticus TaxID=3034024 RepID=UPI0023E8A33A|nr:DUF2391 domain-containing protein [Halorussus sp. DT80]
MSDSGSATPPSDPPHEPELSDLLDELEELEETVDDPDERQQVRETIRVARRVQPTPFGRVIRGFDRHDASEALVGSVLIGVPMLAEGGTLEIGAFLALHPVSFVATVLATIGLVVGVLYVAEIQQVEIYRPFFGVIPRRLVGVLGISFVTAVALMTGWGRIEWSDPWLALCQTTVAFAPMSLAAALGDILPGS